mmetsp:Transcript_62717/g.110757  ORF Transcript_62717/g.110757 Transcript_62717/m.110757 type:complete len:268 (-) Transcript_62717:36-839(-)
MVVREHKSARKVLQKLLQPAEFLFELGRQIGGGSDLCQHFPHFAHRLHFLLLENLGAQRQEGVIGQNRLQHEVAVEDVVHEALHWHHHQLSLRELQMTEVRRSLSDVIGAHEAPSEAVAHDRKECANGGIFVPVGATEHCEALGGPGDKSLLHLLQAPGYQFLHHVCVDKWIGHVESRALKARRAGSIGPLGSTTHPWVHALVAGLVSLGEEGTAGEVLVQLLGDLLGLVEVLRSRGGFLDIHQHPVFVHDGSTHQMRFARLHQAQL